MSQFAPSHFALALPSQAAGRRRSAAACALVLAVLIPALLILSACATGSQGLPSGFTVTPVTSLSISPARLLPPGTGSCPGPPTNSNPCLSLAVAGQPFTAMIPVTGGTPSYSCNAASAPTGS